jgi:hypothetical protein
MKRLIDLLKQHNWQKSMLTSDQMEKGSDWRLRVDERLLNRHGCTDQDREREREREREGGRGVAIRKSVCVCVCVCESWIASRGADSAQIDGIFFLVNKINKSIKVLKNSWSLPRWHDPSFKHDPALWPEFWNLGQVFFFFFFPIS